MTLGITLQYQRDIAVANERLAELRIENQQLRNQPCVLPDAPVLPGHEFGPKMISVCVNLAMKIGLRASDMPLLGTAIRHHDVRMLMLEPGVDWKTEDMADAYDRLAEKIGSPMAVLTDGACELRDSGQPLRKRRKNTLQLGDSKPFATNALKYRKDIQRWTRCQNVVSLSLTFVNEQGLFRGAADQLSKLLSTWAMCETSQTVAARLLEFLRQHEQNLPDGFP